MARKPVPVPPKQTGAGLVCFGQFSPSHLATSIRPVQPRHLVDRKSLKCCVAHTDVAMTWLRYAPYVLRRVRGPCGVDAGRLGG